MDINKQIVNAKRRLDTFDPRGSKCPICKASFRNGCNHSVKQANERLFELYLKAMSQRNQRNF